MSPAAKKTRADDRPADERAEELMQRVVTDGSRMLKRVFGRVREETEDILAEARSMHAGTGSGTRRAKSSGTSSSPKS